jgi:hypothetical protein
LPSGGHCQLRWKNYGAAADTWESLANLDGSAEKVKEFEATPAKAKPAAAKAKPASPKQAPKQASRSGRVGAGKRTTSDAQLAMPSNVFNANARATVTVEDAASPEPPSKKPRGRPPSAKKPAPAKKEAAAKAEKPAPAKKVAAAKAEKEDEDPEEAKQLAALKKRCASLNMRGRVPD